VAIHPLRRRRGLCRLLIGQLPGGFKELDFLLSGWGFWVFCYLSICIASNIRLSVSDIRGTLPGLGWAVLPFLAYNAWKLATGAGGENIPSFLAPVLGTVYSVLVLALVMVALGFAVIYAISAIYFWLRYRRPLNPFA
jgi:hypothetical protein